MKTITLAMLNSLNLRSASLDVDCIGKVILPCIGSTKHLRQQSALLVFGAVIYVGIVTWASNDAI